jgi:two-component system sensor histidine kinase KdpD
MEVVSANGRLTGAVRAARVAATIGAAVLASTVAIGLVERYLGITYAAPLYLLAVLAVGMRHGTIPAVATAVIGFLAYDFLFVEPLYTFTIRDPNELLNLLLLLVVAAAIGRLVALQAEHAAELTQRAKEAQALFGISRALAETHIVEEAAAMVLERLADATAMDRIWFGFGPSPAEERVIADTSPGQAMPIPGWQVSERDDLRPR